MRITRRRALFGAGALALAGLGAGLFGLAPGGVSRRTLEVISRVYGPGIADTAAAMEFSQVYEDFVLAKGIPGIGTNAIYRFGVDELSLADPVERKITASVINKFAMSTNVVRAEETGEALRFIGLFHPYQGTCLNQLGADAIG